MSSRGAGPTGHQWNGTSKDPKAPRASKGSVEPQARLALTVSPVRPGLSVLPVLPDPEEPEAIKGRPAYKVQSALLVPRAPGETPAWWAVLGLLDHKAKEGQGDLPDSSDSREKPAIREKPGQQALREIQGLRELPGH